MTSKVMMLIPLTEGDDYERDDADDFLFPLSNDGDR